MIAVVCLEDRNGMLFGSRRVSRDAAQQQDLLNWIGDRKLWMNDYSAPLFAGADIAIEEDFLHLAGPGEVCFVENQPLRPVEDRIEALVVYRWNRSYPATMKLDLDLGTYALKETVEFPGNSHETITREIYERRS